MTYDLRRLRLHGLIERIPKSHRYEVTPAGLRIALFFTRTYARLLRPKLAEIMPAGSHGDSTLRLQLEIDRCCEEAKTRRLKTRLNYINLLGKERSLHFHLNRNSSKWTHFELSKFWWVAT
jgi:hypothetical protein